MPTEAQLKAQMQAAIAAKKKQAEQTKEESNPTSVLEPTPTPVTPPPPPSVKPSPIEPSSHPTTTSNSDSKPTISPTPHSLTFYGHSIRLTIHRQEVYFSLEDILPLSNNHEAQMRYVEFKNQPSTREKAESLIKTIVFTNENGTEKLDGAKATQVIEVMHALKLSSPGPMGRWLAEISNQYHTKDEKSED